MSIKERVDRRTAQALDLVVSCIRSKLREPADPVSVIMKKNIDERSLDRWAIEIGRNVAMGLHDTFEEDAETISDLEMEPR